MFAKTSSRKDVVVAARGNLTTNGVCSSTATMSRRNSLQPGDPFLFSRKRNTMAKNYQSEVQDAVSDVDFDSNGYQIELTTNHGTILLDLLPEVVPGHCKNMIGLAKIGFYDGLSFHRIIGGFMIQGGCPSGTGTGGPGYNIDAEFNDTKHVDGVLSMARSADPNSAGSQFFICLGTHPHLDNQYTAFGKTADDASLDVVRTLGALETDRQDRPGTPAVIESAKVIAVSRS